MAGTVILGAGHAGLSVARELRALRPDRPITVVTRDDGHLYPKPQLSTSLRLGKQADELIQTRAEALREAGLDLVARRSVTAIDRGTRTLALDDGNRLAYDELVLALGAMPFVPAMAGTAAHGVLTINHLDDLRRFHAMLADLPGDRPVLVVGGGLIGIELAADLLTRGRVVHVVDPGAGPLPRLLPAPAAAGLASALEQAGAVFHWGQTVASLEGRPGDYHATLADGTAIAIGSVLSAVGLRPNVELAREAGLGIGRGILVDAGLRAAEHVYALGDCAELPGGLYLPFIKPIAEQAKYLARAIAGTASGPLVLGNFAVAVKVPQWPVMSTTPLPDEAGSWDEQIDERGTLCRLMGADGQLLRVVATGNRTAELRGHLARVPALLPALDAPPR